MLHFILLMAIIVCSYYVGKLLNGYSHKNLAEPEHPKGWTQSRHVNYRCDKHTLLTTYSFLLAPWTYNYCEGQHVKSTSHTLYAKLSRRSFALDEWLHRQHHTVPRHSHNRRHSVESASDDRPRRGCERAVLHDGRTRYAAA